MSRYKAINGQFFRKLFLSKYLSAFFGLFFVMITIGVWKLSEADNLEQLSNNIESHSQIYAGQVEKRLRNITFNLDELAGYGPPLSFKEESDWDTRTAFYIDTFLGIESILWVDNQLIIRRVTSKENDDYYVGEQMNYHQDSLKYTSLIVPVYDGDEMNGFIVSNIDVSKLLLSIGEELEYDYMIQVYYEDELLAASSNFEKSNSNIFAMKDIQFKNETYSIIIGPSKEMIIQINSSSYMVLTLGLLLSLLMSGLLLGLQVVRSKAKILSDKSAELIDKNQQLENQKIQLNQASSKLESLVAKKTIELTRTVEILQNEKDLAHKYLNDLQEAGNIFENSIKNAPIPIMIHAEDGTVLNLSKTWTMLTDYSMTDIPTIYAWTEVAYGQKKQEVIDFIQQLYNITGVQHDGEFQVRTKNGRVLTWDFNSGYIGNLPDGRAVAMSTATDVTERIKREEEIEYLSYHDALTGLHNRRYYNTFLHEIDDKDNFPLTVVMCDINGLKLVNDAFGHESGDQLLKAAAKVISSACKNEDMIARIGGDEFIIVMPNTDAKNAEEIISIIKKDSKKIQINSIELSISFGIKTKTKTNEDLQDIYRGAEDSMYREKLSEIPSMRSSAIGTILNTLHEKDENSEIHSRLVSKIAVQIATEIGMSRERIGEIHTAGLLHDIGKIIIPTSIITKKGKLTEDEYDLIKKHPEIGYRILNSSKDMRDISEIILYHHERWDGTGYPNQVKGDKIPIQSRIIAIADAFDAMTSERPYRDSLSTSEALTEILENAGTQFDPELAKVFVDNADKILDSNL